MELEFKCDSEGCDFKVKYDWPEEDGLPSSQRGAVLVGENKHTNPLSNHHDATKIGLGSDSEYKGFIYGHGCFTARYKRKEIQVKATSNFAHITNFDEDMANGLK